MPAIADDILTTSACFMSADLNLTLTCGRGRHLGELLVFAGISRRNVCSYEPWDCVVQWGTIGGCHRRSECLLTITQLQRGLRCGGAGLTTYVQVDYRCLESGEMLKLIKLRDFGKYTNNKVKL